MREAIYQFLLNCDVFPLICLYNSLLYGILCVQKHSHRREASNDSSGLHNSGSEEEEEQEGGGEGVRCGGEGLVEDGGSNSEGEGKVSVLHTQSSLLYQCTFAISFQPPQKRAKRYIHIILHCTAHVYIRCM